MATGAAAAAMPAVGAGTVSEEKKEEATIQDPTPISTPASDAALKPVPAPASATTTPSAPLPPAPATTTPSAPLSSTPASTAEKGWKITIKNSDGSTREIILESLDDKAPQHVKIEPLHPDDEKSTQIVESERLLPDSDNPSDAEKASKSDPKNSSKANPAIARRLRIYLIIQHILTALFSLTIIAIMALTLAKYRSTETIHGAWPVAPFLTPTFVMLAMAVLTCTADLITLCMQCCGAKTAKNATAVSGYIRSAVGVAQTIMSAAGSGFFKYAENTSLGRDLWGWSCSDAADAMASVNSSGMLCTSNTGAFALGIMQTVLQVLNVVIPLYAKLRPGGMTDAEEDDAKLMDDATANVGMLGMPSGGQ